MEIVELSEPFAGITGEDGHENVSTNGIRAVFDRDLLYLLGFGVDGEPRPGRPGGDHHRL